MMEENNIIPLVPMQVPLTEEEKQEVELFAGIGYTIQKIAILLEEDYQKLMFDYKNPHSHFHQAYQKGLLKAKADVDSANLENAINLKQTAAQRMDKIWEEQKLENLKNEIFNT